MAGKFTEHCPVQERRTTNRSRSYTAYYKLRINANIELETKIYYISDGIQDNVFHKNTMYDMQIIREL
jgi:hypothetical protein